MLTSVCTRDRMMMMTFLIKSKKKTAKAKFSKNCTFNWMEPSLAWRRLSLRERDCEFVEKKGGEKSKIERERDCTRKRGRESKIERERERERERETWFLFLNFFLEKVSWQCDDRASSPCRRRRHKLMTNGQIVCQFLFNANCYSEREPKFCPFCFIRRSLMQ